MAIPLTSNACLAHHRDGYVILLCGVCGHRRDLETTSLARRFGWDVPVRLLAPKFRCTGCQARQVQVSFGYDSRPRGWKKNPT